MLILRYFFIIEIKIFLSYDSLMISRTSVNSEIMHGTPCFTGTRVPIKNLFDYLEAGDSLDDFLEGFPGVSREQAIAVIDLAARGFLDTLSMK